MAGSDPRRDKLRAIAERQGLVGALNDSKWQGILDQLVPMHLPVRAKLISDNEISDWTVLGNVPSGYIEPVSIGPYLCLEIEWLEIRSETAGDLERVRKLLAEVNVRFSISGNIMHMDAYLRSQATGSR